MAIDLSKELEAAERKIKQYSKLNQAIPKDLLDYYTNLLSAVGSSGGGGGGITQTQVQTAMTNALNSQSQLEFADTLLEDSTGTLFHSTKTVNEETGAVTYTTQLPGGALYTPVNPITVPSKSNLVAIQNNITDIVNKTIITARDTINVLTAFNTNAALLANSTASNQVPASIYLVNPTATTPHWVGVCADPSPISGTTEMLVSFRNPGTEEFQLLVDLNYFNAVFGNGGFNTLGYSLVRSSNPIVYTSLGSSLSSSSFVRFIIRGT